MNLGYSVRGVWVCPWGCPFWSTSSHKQRKLGADSIIHCLYWFLSLFSSIWCLPSLPLSPFFKVQYITSPLTVSHPPPPPPALSLSVMFWLTSVMVFVSPFPDLQLSGTHAQTYTHSKTANGFYLPRLSQWGITVLVHHEGNLQTHVADRTLSIRAI